MSDPDESYVHERGLRENLSSLHLIAYLGSTIYFKIPSTQYLHWKREIMKDGLHCPGQQLMAT